MKLRCEIAIPSGMRRMRTLVRLDVQHPEEFVLSSANSPAEATHQLVDAVGMPLLTARSEVDPGLASEVVRSGFQELPETAFLLAAVRAGHRVVDVGAQVGYYSMLLARLAGRAGQIDALEPDPDHAQVLAANRALTALIAPHAAPIHLYAVALTDRAQPVRLHRSDRDPGTHTLTPSGKDYLDSVVVPGTTLDRFRWPENDRTRPIHVLKIDAPGSESAILRGGERTLVQDRPLVVVTVRPANYPESVGELLTTLTERGYDLLRLLASAAGDPHQLVTEAARLLRAQEVANFLRRKPIPPLATLIAEATVGEAH